MAGTPDGPPPGWAVLFRAIDNGTRVTLEVGDGQAQQMGYALQAQGIPYAQQLLGQALGPLGVQQAAMYQTVAQGMVYINRTPLSPAEFADEYYEQCCSDKPRTPQDRARELLFDHLTWEEQEEWWLTNRVTVTAKSGRRYWLSGTDCGRDDRHTFCVYIGNNECPAEDRVLGLKLAIEADEAQFLRTAVDRGVSGLANDPQRQMNQIFTAALGQYNCVRFHPDPWNLHEGYSRWERLRRWWRRDVS